MEISSNFTYVSDIKFNENIFSGSPVVTYGQKERQI
jgi:hypothetical protein